MLTQLAIGKLLVPSKRQEIPDGKIAGLYLVIQPSGARSWALRYRIEGKPKKLTIGPYPAVDLAAARRRAQEAHVAIANGADPAAQKKASRETRKSEQNANDRVAQVAAAFVERYAKHKVGASWAAETERLLKVEIIPKIGSKRLGDVKRSDVNDILDGMVDRGVPINANRALSVFRRMCNWAIERGIISTSPCERIKAPSAENSRDRILNENELRFAWRAFDRVGWPFGPMAKLLSLTAARRDEIASGSWREIDPAAKTWMIEKERSKNGVAHEIPLSDSAISILKGLPRIGDKSDGLIFTTTGHTPISGFSRAKASIDAAILEEMRTDAKAVGEDSDGVLPPVPWVFHDLRRTAASGMAGLGIAPHVVEAVLNHKSGTIRGVAAVYNRYNYAAEKRAALDAWSQRLDAIVNGADLSNIVAMKARG